MGTPFKGKAFRQLQDEWEHRLAAEGLPNIERPDGSIVHGGKALRYHVRAALRSRVDRYYQLAGQWAHDRVFRNRTQRMVWELHVEGRTHRAITKLLGPMRMHQPRRVLEVIQQERRLMGVYYAEQPPAEDETPQTLLEQHLEAEGFGRDFDFDDHMAGPGDPIRRIRRSME